MTSPQTEMEITSSSLPVTCLRHINRSLAFGATLTSSLPPGDATHMRGEYPKDLFSIRERRQGWVVLHIFGMMYMFVSLAIICDEFFLPALGVIIDKFDMSNDVASWPQQDRPQSSSLHF